MVLIGDKPILWHIMKILEQYSGKKIGDFGLGMNPEFLRESNAFEDAMELDHIVFRYEDHKTLKMLRELYEPWKTDKIEVNTRTAEMIKYYYFNYDTTNNKKKILFSSGFSMFTHCIWGRLYIWIIEKY
jgi:UDP-glucose 6-dehydrogenase